MKGVKIMNRLKELRKEKKLTQKELADIIGTTKLTISNWENDKHSMNSEKAEQLADFFEVSIGYLLGYEDLLDQIEEADTVISENMSQIKELLSVVASTYNSRYKNSLELLKSLREVAEVTDIDSKTLIEAIDILEDNFKDIDYSVKRIRTAQIEFMKLQNLKRRLNEHTD